MTNDSSDQPLLVVRDLTTTFHTDEGEVRAVDGIDLQIAAGESVGLVGESGSGKSVTAKSLMGLVPTPPGVVEAETITFDGTDLHAASSRQLRKLRGNGMSMVFQNPTGSLDPLMKVGDQLTEAMRAHGDVSRSRARERSTELLEMVHIDRASDRLDAYPHELSGGQCQRVMIAIAIANDPQLLIADEPTTALDVTVQAEILALLDELRDSTGMALLFITHDFGVVSEVCDRILVMYAGRIVEQAGVGEIIDDPLHPYTRQLIACVPRLGQPERSLDAIEGVPPSLATWPWTDACAFAPRCDVEIDECTEHEIAMEDLGARHSRCVRASELREGANA